MKKNGGEARGSHIGWKGGRLLEEMQEQWREGDARETERWGERKREHF